MSLHKQLECNKGLFIYKVFNSEAPEYTSNPYTRPSPFYSNSSNHQLSLPRQRIDVFKTSIAFSGAFL